MFEFIPYDKIKNRINYKFINNNIKRDEFIVTEKIHGAHLDIIIHVESGKIDFASRKNVLSFDNDFNFLITSGLKKKLLDGSRDLLIGINPHLQDAKYITIAGEIFGGEYPKMENNYKRVQPGISYSPNIEFIAFDLSLTLKDDTIKYMSFDHSESILESSNIMFTKCLFRGTLEECKNYNYTFNSTIPEILNLPKLDINIAEGVVVRYDNEDNEDIRVLFKMKTEKFKETVEGLKLPKNLIANFDYIKNKITEARLNNVLSKYDKQESNETILEDYLKDIIEELESEELKFKKNNINQLKHLIKVEIEPLLYNDI